MNQKLPGAKTQGVAANAATNSASRAKYKKFAKEAHHLPPIQIRDPKKQAEARKVGEELAGKKGKDNPDYLDQGTLESVQSARSQASSVAQSAVEGTKSVFGNLFGQAASGIQSLFSNEPVSDKIKKLRIPFITLSTVIFAPLTALSGLNFFRDLFSSKGKPPFWSGLKFLVSGAFLYGLWSTIKGGASKFKNMGAIAMGYIAYFLVATVNNLYDGKSKVGTVLDKATGGEASKGIKTFMNMFKTPYELITGGPSTQDFKFTEPPPAEVSQGFNNTLNSETQNSYEVGKRNIES